MLHQENSGNPAKQSPKNKKIVQSGHPAWYSTFNGKKLTFLTKMLVENCAS
jgi:hypothetical protein